MLGAEDDVAGPCACRAAASAASVEVEAVSSMWPFQEAGSPSRSASQASDDLLQLGCGRRGAPEHRVLVEGRGEELGEDSRLGRGCREVGEESRVLPVSHPGHEDLVQIAQHRGERLAPLGRRAGSRDRISPGSTVRQHRQSPRSPGSARPTRAPPARLRGSCSYQGQHLPEGAHLRARPRVRSGRLDLAGDAELDGVHPHRNRPLELVVGTVADEEQSRASTPRSSKAVR